jgi:hypothetical protein
MAEYRWERASNGAVPEGAPADGHGWMWRDTDDGQEREPLWLVRSLPGSDGSVQLGWLRRGEGAFVGPERHEAPVEEYEVLLDAGEWTWAQPDPDDNVDLAAAGGVACGQAADGSPIYATVRDREGEGEQPGGNPARIGLDFNRKVLVAPAAAETPAAAPAPAAPDDATGYRWERASGGEIPAGAPENGHGWHWGDDADGSPVVRVPEWLARSLPDADGTVLLGSVERGRPAQLGGSPVEEYEVLVDAGEWAQPEPIDTGDDLVFDFAAAGGVVSGRLADGTPLYATLRDREGEGIEPGGRQARQSMDFNYRVLVARTGAAAEPSAPAGTDTPAEEPAGPSVVVRALDLRGEVVEIANTGGAAIDIGGWRLHDEGSTKGFVFPAGTILEAGASVRVRSGPGAAKAGPGELKWKTSNVWNDKGDTAFLKDPAGELVDFLKA